MASFDLSKLKQLDDELTKVLSDMQVCWILWLRIVCVLVRAVEP